MSESTTAAAIVVSLILMCPQAHKYGTRRLCVQDTASLCLFAQNRLTGICLSIGYTGTCAVAVINGKIVRESLQEVRIGGSTLTQFFMQLVQQRGQDVNWQRVSAISSMRGKALITMVRDAKEKICYVRGKDDPTSEDSARQVDLEIDGTGERLTMGAECWLCPEILFDPSVVGRGGASVQEAVIRAALTATPDTQVIWTLLQNVVLTGGSARFPGMAARLTEELSAILHQKPGGLENPNEHKVHVSPPLDDSYGPFHGGCNCLRMTNHITNSSFDCRCSLCFARVFPGSCMQVARGVGPGRYRLECTRPKVS